MPEREDDPLRAHVERLPEELSPPRDLWPGIHERVVRSSRARRSRARLAAVGGSALALAAAAGFVVAMRGRPTTGPAGTATASFVAPAPFATAMFPGESDYVSAQKMLDEELAARRGQLPATETTVIDENLRIVDAAIAATRAALASRPEDMELRAELDRDWEDKIDLLRDAVELPNGR